jgi:hypothetical protein
MSHVRAVRGERGTRDPSRHATGAVDAARECARNQRWKVPSQDRRPRIRDRDSCGTDPKSPVDYVR